MVKLAEYPKEGDLVVCTVLDVKSFGAFAFLDEYEKEGFIHVTEVATGWIKYIRDYVRENQKIVCKVLRIDKSKGHIDLTLKQVNAHQKKETVQEWKNEQKAEKLFEMFAATLGKDVDACYKDFGYALVKNYGSLYNALENIAFDKKINTPELGSLDAEKLIALARANIAAPKVNISGTIEVTCPLSDGVIHVKNALSKAEKDEGDVKINVQYMGAPKYRILVTAPDYKKAEKELNKAAEKAINAIKKSGGDGAFHRQEA